MKNSNGFPLCFAVIGQNRSCTLLSEQQQECQSLLVAMGRTNLTLDSEAGICQTHTSMFFSKEDQRQGRGTVEQLLSQHKGSVYQTGYTWPPALLQAGKLKLKGKNLVQTYFTSEENSLKKIL